MGVTLLLDVGNTACKWRLQGEGVPEGVSEGRVSHQKNWALLVERLPSELPDVLAVSSVAGAEGNALLAGALQKKYRLVPVFVMAQPTCLGVTNGYQEATRLGVDRWLGVIEAHALYGAAIVVDFGSAVTLDVIEATGQHQGGYIVPGLSLLRRSLATDTADVLFEGAQATGLEPGKNTGQAVEQGLLRMLRAFVVDVVVAHQQKLDDTYTLVVTGGDADQILPLLPAELAVKRHDGLVLDGLQRVIANKNIL